MFIVVHIEGLLVKEVNDQQYEDFILVLLTEIVSQELSKECSLDTVDIHVNGDIRTVKVSKDTELVFDYVLNYPEMLSGSPFLSITNLAGGIKQDLIRIFKRIVSKEYGGVLNDSEPFYILMEAELIDRKFCLIEIEIKRNI